MSYLLDANVLCEATRPQAEARVLDWLDRHDAELHVSAITLGEILKGIRFLSSFDSLLAATVSLHGLTLVTRNESDFPPEIPLLNPWLR